MPDTDDLGIFEALTQQLQDRDENMAKTVALLRAGDHAREALEEKLQLFADNLAHAQEKLHASGAEIDKGNAIIDKMHADSRALKEKVRVKGDVIRRQEAAVTDLKNKVRALREGH